MRIHCEIYLSDYFMKHNLMHMSLYLIWFHKIRIKYVKKKSPRTIIRKNTISPCLPRLHVVDIGWPVSHEKLLIFMGDYIRLFYQRQKRVRSLSNSGTWLLNKFRTGTLCRMFIDSYLLTIKKKSVIFSRNKQIPQRNTMLS